MVCGVKCRSRYAKTLKTRDCCKMVDAVFLSVGCWKMSAETSATVVFVEFETEEEALHIANDTEYGLISAVFTENLRTGLRFAKEIEAGSVHINNMTIHDEMALPHGGAKASGFGRFNNTAGLDEWLRTKSITWRN